MGGHWAEAYQELRPDLQPARTDIEISNQRAAELTAAQEQIARRRASISVLRTEITRLQAENTRLQALQHSLLSDVEEVEEAIWPARAVAARGLGRPGGRRPPHTAFSGAPGRGGTGGSPRIGRR